MLTSDSRCRRWSQNKVVLLKLKQTNVKSQKLNATTVSSVSGGGAWPLFDCSVTDSVAWVSQRAALLPAEDASIFGTISLKLAAVISEYV